MPAAMPEPLINIPEWTVSELSAALRRTVEEAYPYVRVRGEISGFRGPHSSGHAYFALKDEGARIDAVVWRNAYARMRVKPEDGLEVIATGRLTTYPGRSTYQIVIEALEPSGLGALMALLEQRKQKLAAEGLFDEARKQLLPRLPEVIGVVTSPTGAVIRDILHRLADRFPRRVLVWPVRVQGEGAAEEIAAAIRGFNALPVGGDIPRPDLIIVARGGGSIEDLWAFNEETVVRAAADSLIALIAAVGHETDVTLIDFAADRRAPTPTAAAEMAVPVRAELIARLDALGQRTFACWRHGQDRRRADLRAAARALPAPDSLLGPARQRLDAAATRLPRALIAHARRHRADYAGVAGRLNRGLLRVRVAQARERLAALAARGRRGLQVRLARERARLGGAGQLLAALSYRGVLTRGFALVRGPDQRPIRSADAVSPGLRIDIEFADGRVGATADGGGRTAAQQPSAPKPPPSPPPATRATAKPAAPPGRKRSRRPGSPEQGSLF